jgi:hypothetical protein
MASDEDMDSSSLKQLDYLQAKLTEVKACMHNSEPESKQELEILWQRVKTTSNLLTYLKSKARKIAIPHLAQTSCGIKQLDGVGLVDRNGVPLSNWSRTVDLSPFDGQDRNTCQEVDEEIYKSVEMVAEVMESLVKRVIMAESETASEKEKVNLGQEEIKKKGLEIEKMSVKIDEMERFSTDTIGALSEMRERVQDLVVETSRQRDRAAENEEELSRVKRDFESLKSYVSSLISVRETLLSSENQFQTIEKLFERLVCHVT